ncbi:unnamed protein product [Brassicogethes aeneus]|uniref:Uncharacterized protein n=1 Tax=Brassicogethes aeneus TaxID=1431903 RepID=A0A9P0BN16_BRAAE|nr:unnamed protein product [Brassicogethes aeneus]
MFFKIIVSALLVSTVFSRRVSINNYQQKELTVSITGRDDIKMPPHSQIPLDLEENWSGKISGCSEMCEGPRTEVELTLGAEMDQYDVSLINGWNLPMKIVPQNGDNCQASVCTPNMLHICPDEDRVLNARGIPVACRNSPMVFKKVCPNSITDENDRPAKVHNCHAEGYKVMFGQ